MVSKYERADDFAFGFRAIKDAYQRILNKEFAPKIIMRDAALAIHNGFEKVFGPDIISLMCYTHVIRAVDRRPVDSAANKKEIKKDLSTLRLAYDQRTFETGCVLFLAKYSITEPGFTDYFQNTWLRQNSNWYNGACRRMVSTNNNIEDWNVLLKRFGTYWKIHGLNQCKIDLMNILAKESAEYAQDKRPFKYDVTISNRMMKDGYDLSKTSSIVRQKGDDDKGRCFIRKGGSRDELTEAHVNEFLNAEYETFDNFAAHFLDIYIVTFENDVKTWKETVSCTCPAFVDYFMCKHIMCMVYSLGIERYKIEHPIAPNRAPGRQPNATPALQIP